MDTLCSPPQFLSTSSGVMIAAFLVFATGVGNPLGVADELPAKPQDASQLDLKTQRVIVFKDGYCLVVKQGSATTDADGTVYTDEVPDAAVLGSFWAVPEQGTIQSLVAGWVDTESKTQRKVDCTTVVEMVQANLGKTCSFEIGEQRIEGTLLKILSNAPVVNESASRGMVASDAGSSANSTTTLATVSASFFVVRTESGDKMIQASSVSNLTIEYMNSQIEQSVTKKARHKRLSLHFGQPNSAVKIHLMYFRPDVRWIPTYRINLTSQPSVAFRGKKGSGQADGRKRAELFMQGEIINEAEDFIDVPFHVVVGVPNFRFRSTPSPMVLEATLRNSLSQAAPDMMGLSNNQFSNGLYGQRSGEFSSNRAMGEAARTAVELPDELVGKGGNDLFVYELASMTLKRGQRALVPILRTDVDYRDIYTWDLEIMHSESFATTSAASISPLVLSESKVWRQVELINNTDIPWTTGAAMLMDDQQPLAQELLTYTSPGGICRVPVTVSVDLRGKVDDSEVQRELNALKWRGQNFLRVEGLIEAELANNKLVPVPVEVRLRFGGKATQVSDDGRITLEAFRQDDWHERRGNAINNSSMIFWSQTVMPGECFKPTVNYEFYLQH
ncbi:hypothetical protein [Aureliella helgolandensis]|uniref:DUF4139 domain-containing protein n=1 Tax=Aureliella helgolandensis TaxID=2527968 RepID=A0A518GG83_9BACT|nr:hypothetical protein [Aureliella helgolandensis]QDV27612.1 hypothetical protein Q31a_60040 [Aureliella helgolandensis]